MNMLLFGRRGLIALSMLFVFAAGLTRAQTKPPADPAAVPARKTKGKRKSRKNVPTKAPKKPVPRKPRPNEGLRDKGEAFFGDIPPSTKSQAR